MINLADGTVAYAVLSRGGLGGVGNKLFAVPWHLLSVDREDRRLILDVSESVLEDSPGFNPDHWPTLDEVRWVGKETVGGDTV